MIVVADTSVVLNLCLIAQEKLLPHLFGEILCPNSVHAAFTRLTDCDPRFSGLVFPEFINLMPAGRIRADLKLNHRIHDGEIESISLALNSNTEALLMDERAGRQAASALNLRCIGILGILLQAKSLGLIESVSPLLGQLESRGRFWMAPALVKRILEAADEALATPHPRRNGKTRSRPRSHRRPLHTLGRTPGHRGCGIRTWGRSSVAPVSRFHRLPPAKWKCHTLRITISLLDDLALQDFTEEDIRLDLACALFAEGRFTTICILSRRGKLEQIISTP